MIELLFNDISIGVAIGLVIIFALELVRFFANLFY